MNQVSKPIEEIFLESLLKISFVSILIVSSVDFYFTQFTVTRSILIDSAIFFAIVSTHVLRKNGYFIFAVLWIGFIVMAAMFYQSIDADTLTTSSMAVVMLIGFGFSVLLKGRLPLALHAFTLLGMMTVFTWLALHPLQYGKPNANDIIVAGITYCVLYTIMAYSSWLLKQRFDESYKLLAKNNIELIEKTHEIETQNEELLQSQENLSQLTHHLESIIETRTQEVKNQHERLIRYAYSNAHHVRGPVARVLGLIQLSKMEANLDYPFLIQKIEEQTLKIDEVVKGINKALET